MRAMAVPSILAATWLLAGCDRREPDEKINSEEPKATAMPRAVAPATKSAVAEIAQPAIVPSGEIPKLDETELAKLAPEFKKYARAAQRDLAGALRLIAEELPRNRQDEARAALLVLFGTQLLDTTPYLASSIVDERVRRSALSRVGHHWAGQQPREFFDFAMENFSGEEQGQLLGMAIREAADRGNFSEGIAMWNAMPASQDSEEAALSALVSAFGKRSLEEAVSWTRSLPDRERHIAFKELLPIIAEKKGFEGLLGVPPLLGEDGSAYATLVEEAVKILKTQDESVAVMWLKTLPASRQAHAAQSLIARMPIGKIDGIIAYAFELPDADSRRNAVSAVTERVTRRDFGAAGSWVLALPDDVRERGVRRLVATQYDIDSSRLAEWVKTLRGGKDRDFAVAEFARFVRKTDKQSALDWAAAIEDEELRLKVEREVGR
jgi:hypothetical protein